jgi:hypothetical protein
LWHPKRLRGRRRVDQRAEAERRRYFVDRVAWPTFIMATLLLMLTIVDGVVTVALLDRGCEEANPVMQVLLDRGMGAFFIGKYVLTAAFLPFAVVMCRYRLFGTNVRVGHFLPIAVALYVVLIVYQTALWSRSEADAPVAVSSERMRMR